MGQVNISDIPLGEGADGTSELPQLGATVRGVALPIGLKAVPFLEGVGPTPTNELAEITFMIPDDTALRLAPTIIRVDVPQALLHAWAAFEPPSLAESVAGFRRDLERADAQAERTVRAGDHLAKMVEVALQCMTLQTQAIVAIPGSNVAIGELLASAVAWWDKERHNDGE